MIEISESKTRNYVKEGKRMLITSWYYDERDQMFKENKFRGIKKDGI